MLRLLPLALTVQKKKSFQLETKFFEKTSTEPEDRVRLVEHRQRPVSNASQVKFAQEGKGPKRGVHAATGKRSQGLLPDRSQGRPCCSRRKNWERPFSKDCRSSPQSGWQPGQSSSKLTVLYKSWQAPGEGLGHAESDPVKVTMGRAVLEAGWAGLRSPLQSAWGQLVCLGSARHP